jgi:hypothetical protein
MTFGIWRSTWYWGLILLCGFVVSARGAIEPGSNPRDTLVYKDGDRIQGVVVRKTPEEIVFKSDRFGELKVRAQDAVIIPAEPTEAPVAAKPAAPKPVATAAKPAVPTPVPAAERAEAVAKAEAERAEVERMTIWDRFTPGVMTAKVRGFFGPWKGRFAFSTEVVSDSADRNNHSAEARVTRKWSRNELQMSGRYDYAEANDIPTTDTIKTSANVRHDFSKQWFAHYRSSAEWNRASKLRGAPNDYLLLQQEIGAGYNVYASPSRKVRAGVSQNLFDIWNSAPTPNHSSRVVQSAFEEIELKLPWQMGLTQRGVWYPVNDQVDGWENRFELNKKLTETLSTALRHEIRRNNPDGSAQDFTRLKLMFGFDF